MGLQLSFLNRIKPQNRQQIACMYLGIKGGSVYLYYKQLFKYTDQLNDLLKRLCFIFFKTIVLSPPLREEQLFLICVCVLDYVCMVVHVPVCMVFMSMCVCASGG